MKSRSLIPNAIKTILFQLQEWILPSVCMVCEQSILNGYTPYLCQPCWSQLYTPTPPKRLGSYLIHSCGPYRGVFRKHLIGAKLKQDLKSLDFLQRLLDTKLQDQNLFSDVDCLVTIPASTLRTWLRGWDLNHLLCMKIQNATKIPFPNKGLRKTRHAPRQAKIISKKARKRNVKGLFKAHPSLANQHVLLWDDVYTTGATIGSAIKALEDLGVRRITVLTLLQRPS